MIVDRMKNYTYFAACLLTVLYVVVFFGITYYKRYALLKVFRVAIFIL